MNLEERTARLTVLIDPRKKAVFERLCAAEDTTASQVVRRLIRQYIEERTGEPWSPPDGDSAGADAASGGGTPRGGRARQAKGAGRSGRVSSRRGAAKG